MVTIQMSIFQGLKRRSWSLEKNIQSHSPQELSPLPPGGGTEAQTKSSEPKALCDFIHSSSHVLTVHFKHCLLSLIVAGLRSNSVNPRASWSVDREEFVFSVRPLRRHRKKNLFVLSVSQTKHWHRPGRSSVRTLPKSEQPEEPWNLTALDCWGSFTFHGSLLKTGLFLKGGLGGPLTKVRRSPGKKVQAPSSETREELKVNLRVTDHVNVNSVIFYLHSDTRPSPLWKPRPLWKLHPTVDVVPGVFLTWGWRCTTVDPRPARPGPLRGRNSTVHPLKTKCDADQLRSSCTGKCQRCGFFWRKIPSMQTRWLNGK